MDYPKLKSSAKVAITKFFVLVAGIIMLAVLGPRAFGQELKNAPAVEGILPEPAPRVRVLGSYAAVWPTVAIPPEYPSLARQVRLQGKVLMKVRVGKDGVPKSMAVTPGSHPILVEAVKKAVWKFRWKPYLVNAKPIEFEVEVEVHFGL